MPSNFSYLDTNFPTFERNEDDGSKIAKVQNYLFMLLEQLRYSLSNLDARNFNEAGLDAITDPIYAEIEDAENGLLTLLDIKAGELLAQVAATYETQAAAAQLLMDAQTYADGVGSSLSAAVAAEYETKTAAAGILASAQAYADTAVASLTLYVVDSNGNKSSVSLSGGTINLSGLVTLTGLSGGTTTIDGACIKTGYLDADYIKLRGALAVYSGSTMGGYLGYVNGVAPSGDGFTITSGIGMMAGTYTGQCYVTSNGARLAFGTDSSVTCTTNGVFLTTAGNYVKITLGSLGRYWKISNTGIDWCESDGSIIKSVSMA